MKEILTGKPCSPRDQDN